MIIRPFRDDEVVGVAAWAYAAPFDPYDGDPANAEQYLRVDADGGSYYAVERFGSDIVGFCCFGVEARVRGQQPVEGVLDIGGGVRPDLLSQQLATALFPAIMDFGRERFAPEHFRVAVASFNERSLRLCRSAGFEVRQCFEGPGCDFQELVRADD